MSSLFNQTNLSPGTSFITGGGGGLNQSINTLTGSTNTNNTIDMNNNGGGTKLAVGLQPLVVAYNTANSTRVEILPTLGNKIGFFGTTTGDYWASGNNLTGVNYGVEFNGISSISANIGLPVVNMNALVSTLAVAYPGCVS